MKVRKTIKQSFNPNTEIHSMMETFKDMVNHCIRIGLENNASTLKNSLDAFIQPVKGIQHTVILQTYCNITGNRRLAQMKMSIKRGIKTKSPFITKPYLVSCYGFKINYMLLSIPTGNRQVILVKLNDHTISKLAEDGIKPKSFTITPESLCISVEKDVEEIKPESVIGIDRNLRNITISTQSGTVMYKTNKLLSIKENTSHVISSFKRFDVRVKRHFQQRLGNRRSRRIQQYLHKISKDIVQRAVNTKSILILEDLKGIRKLYRKGNGQGKKYRRKLNSWSFYELQRQITYKAEWEGIPVGFVDPKRTSQLCPICGKRLQEDRLQLRKLLCINCKRTMDRDVIASMNIAYKGWSRFCHPRGLSEEAVNGNLENFRPVISCKLMEAS
ncbi:RNA-guided endonuclease InsQ/TnpB family protein [Candidatus Nitrosotalea okcheonensis]|uniref:Transposase n=1 Tax=Candidatus Nitrosotalea okcheonensis TaxID=1903276 RepID=A0A2H1FI34_9ARCH|nr:RNA-guided endonuclease TnpB family protein [Candidatus Nitrosotalea okcheonensis]SMH72431.1 transposase [Candidatus Nitrosotalea okcheonensis]